MKTWNQTISLFRDDEQKVVAHGYPGLRADCVLGGGAEGLDVQMLLDPFEERFNLPALAVQFCNGRRGFNRKVVGQEVTGFSGLKGLVGHDVFGPGDKVSARRQEVLAKLLKGNISLVHDLGIVYLAWSEQDKRIDHLFKINSYSLDFSFVHGLRMAS